MRRMLVAGLALAGCLLATPAGAWSEPECVDQGNGFLCGVRHTFWLGSERRRQSACIALIKTGTDLPLVGLGITDGSWRMPKGEGLTARVGVDGGARKPRPAATDGTELNVYLPLDEFRSLAEGARLHVELPDATFWYPLRGSKVAIHALARAFDEHARRRDPFASARSQPPAVGFPNVIVPDRAFDLTSVPRELASGGGRAVQGEGGGAGILEHPSAGSVTSTGW